MSKLEAAFHQAMLDTYTESARSINYRPTYFLRMVNEMGGVAAARHLLAKDDTSEGFTTLYLGDRLDLAAEALILKPEFAALFTPAERQRARERLAAMRYTAPWDQGE